MTSIVVVPIVVAASALLLISTLTSSHIAEQLGQELVSDATARVGSEIRSYLRQAVATSDLYARRLETKKLSPTDLKSWEPTLFDDLGTSPDVASICFGNPAGDAVYLQRAHGRLELGYSDGAKDCAAIEWQAFADGSVNRAKPLREYRYDPRTRPWYQAAVTNAAPAWTPAYFWFGDAGGAMETGSGYTRPISIDGKFAGVLTIDVTLGAVSEFLRNQTFASRGAIFIVDDMGMLIAASHGAVTSADGKRLYLAQSDDPSAKAVAEASPQTTTAIASTQAANRDFRRDIDVAGLGPSRASFAAFNPYPGARWRIITVLPESAFLSRSKSMQQRAILLAIFAVAGAVAVGLIFSRRLSNPLMKLTTHVARIGGGDFDARLELAGAKELQQLAGETNRMAAGLRQRMELEKSVELATHVQQSLLPDQTPSIAGLQIHGHSRYCDSTGGDYFDFVDIANLLHERAFVAVGDVTGHGLGAALLMAAARAAVRTSVAVGGETLGQIMGRVNGVLTRDARHGMFMTMMLMIVDPVAHSLVWASAGHDPVILYDPTIDDFIELDGGDLLLGVDENEIYQDFAYTQLKPGCVLFAGTDGVWEAHNEQGEMFGKDRLRDVIRAHAKSDVKKIVDAVQSAIDTFAGSRKLFDDVTYVVIKVAPQA